MSSTSTAVRVNNKRFWIGLSLLLAINAAGWVVYHYLNQPGRTDLLRVEKFASDQVPGHPDRARFSWRFNTYIGDRTDARPPVNIKPALAGKFSWRDERTLEFTADRPLPIATEFTLTIASERLRSVEGFHLPEDYVSRHQTQPLMLMNVTQLDYENQRVFVKLEFNDEVLPSDVIARLSASLPDRKEPIRFRSNMKVEKASREMTVYSDQLSDLQQTDRLTLRIEPGVLAQGGSIATREPLVRSLDISADCVLTELNALARRDDEATIAMEFNGPVTLDALRPLISVAPPVKGLRIEQGYDATTVRLRGAFQPATRYAVRIADASKNAISSPTSKSSAAGVIRLPKASTQTVYVPDRSAGVWFDTPHGYLGTHGHRTLRAKAMNVAQVEVIIARLHDENIATWRNFFAHGDDDRYETSSRRGEISSKGRIVRREMLKLESTKNQSTSIELELDKLLGAQAIQQGVFSVEIRGIDSADPDDYGSSMRDQTLITLSDIGLSAKRAKNEVTVWALSLSKATPIPNAHIRLYSQKNREMGHAQTDATGLATIPLLSLDNAGEEPAVVVAEQMGETGPSINWLDLSRSEVRDTEARTSGRAYLRDAYEAFIYMDRGVYRPGETVRLRTIVRGPNGRGPEAFPVQWRLRGPDGRERAGATTLLDADGAAVWDVPMPEATPTGEWRAWVGLPASTAEEARGHGNSPVVFGSATFQIEDFVPDRLAVNVILEEKPAGELEPAARVEAVPLADKNAAAADASPAANVPDAHTHFAHVQADYLFGQPGAGLAADITFSGSPESFAPPQWKGWTFDDAGGAVTSPVQISALRREQTFAGVVDAAGKIARSCDLREMLLAPREGESEASRALRLAYHGPWRVRATASVLDVGGRAVTARQEMSFHPQGSYIGLRSQAATAGAGTPAQFDVVLVDSGGDIAASDIALEARLYREVWNNSLVMQNGRAIYRSTRLLEPVNAIPAMNIQTAQGRATFTLTPPDGGTYVVAVRNLTSGALTSVEILATDESRAAWDQSVSRENPEHIELIVLPRQMPLIVHTIDALGEIDLKPYLGHLAPPCKAWSIALRDRFTQRVEISQHAFASGESADVVVKSPFRGTLLLTVETDRIISRQVIDMEASTVSVPIQLDDTCGPNAYVSAVVVRAIDPTSAWRAHRAFGVTSIRMDESDRRLNTQIVAPVEIRPLQTLKLAVRVSDSAGQPVPGAAVTVSAVDEGICQLTDFKTPDPFAFFTAMRGLGVSSHDLYGALIPDGNDASASGHIGGDAEGDARYSPPIAAKRVRPVALLSNVIHADEQGIAHLDFNVPQFNGQLRLMAVAYRDQATGAGASAVHVRSPLIVQSSFPRFAAPGDRFRVPITIFNNDTDDGQAQVSVVTESESPGAGDVLHILQGEALADPLARIALPPLPVRRGGQASTFVELIAGPAPGVARVIIQVSLNGETTQEEIELPVRPASPRLIVGATEIVTSVAPLKFHSPGNMLEGSTTLRIHIAPRPHLSLPEGLDYLDRYPHGCAEQITSGCFALAYLQDVGKQLSPDLFESAGAREKIDKGIRRLSLMQTADGGIALWPESGSALPYVSIYAAHFLIVAEQSGHAVPAAFKEKLLQYVRGILMAGGEDGDHPNRVENQAYACYVLALAGRGDRAAMSRLSDYLNQPVVSPLVAPTAQSRFHLAAAWLAAGERARAVAFIPDLLPAFRAQRELAGNFGSGVRDRAVILSTLLTVSPNHPAIPDLAGQLSELGRQGEWRSTQDVAMSVMALGQYLRLSKEEQPYETVELWRGDQLLTRATNGQPLTWKESGASATPKPAGQFEVRLTGATDAKAYVSWIAEGISLEPAAPVSDRGITLTRSYVDHADKPIDPASLISGQLVWVNLNFQSDRDLQGVAIEDLLPAGLEIENARLKSSADSEKPGDENLFTPEARVDVRDDRIVLFADLLAGRAYRYSYLTRAVTVGTFVVPPTRAECMYDLATRAISQAGETLIVKPNLLVGKVALVK